MVCGPTASGKGEVSDALADALTREHGAIVTTLVVDSMQVYREIPTITNQARRRPAELLGIVSVTEEWTVARHRACGGDHSAEHHRSSWTRGPDVPERDIARHSLAPKVEPGTRLAQSLSSGATNRAARRGPRSSSSPAPRHGVRSGTENPLRYLRHLPATGQRDTTPRSPGARRICAVVSKGATLAEMQSAGARINASSPTLSGARAHGLRLRAYHRRAARSLINTRTRQLARRRCGGSISSHEPSKAALH